MFVWGLGLDEWAAVLGTGYLAMRLMLAPVRALGLYAADRGPPGFIGPYLILVSGVAVAALSIGAVSIGTGGLPAGVREVGYSAVGVVGLFLGFAFEMIVEVRTARLWVWLMAFRVPQYREQLQSPDPDARLAAAARLQWLGGYARPALPELLEAFKDSSADVRAAAAHVALNVAAGLPTGEEPEVVSAARAALADPDARVRAGAAALLVHHGAAPPAGVLPALCGGLARPDEPCAGDAADALGLLGPAAAPAVPALRDLALAPDAAVARKLPPGREFVRPADALAAAAVGALGKIGEPAIPALVEVLERGGPTAQSLAARTLGDMGDPARAALPALRRLALQTGNIASVWAKKAITKLGGDIK
jgi:hypothetical protein